VGLGKSLGLELMMEGFVACAALWLLIELWGPAKESEEAEDSGQEEEHKDDDIPRLVDV
jgi:hypothetical protein